MNSNCTYLKKINSDYFTKPYAAANYSRSYKVITVYTQSTVFICLQCFDTVGWAAGRASGL